MQKVHKTCTQQFQCEAMQLTRICEKPITQGARELGIHDWRDPSIAQEVG